MGGDDFSQRISRTKGREATEGVIPGRFALSVGKPDLPAPPGWRWTALSDVAQLESGHTPSRKHPEYWNEGIPWIGIRDAVDNHGRQIHNTYQHVSQLGLENSSARLLPPRTVCLSRTASVGYVVVMGTTMSTSQDFVNWVCGPGLEPEYLKYVLLAENDSLLRFASGTTHQTIYYPEAKAFHALLPPVDVQSAVVRVLGALDDKIELNRKMNATLEAMARALFKAWFVDFDPVRAKGEGRAPSGMDAETAKLFPSEFVESEMGPIPKGWGLVQVKDVCAGLFDGPHATPPEADSGAVFLGIRNFAPTALELADIRYISNADYPAWTKRVVPQAGDIVFTYEATLGFFALIPPGLRCCLGRRTALVRPRAEAQDSHYLFEWFVARPFQDFLHAHRQPGSTVDRIWLKDFPSYPVLQAPSDLVRRFEIVVAPIWARIHSNQSENATLAKLRDGLLPRLLSGELPVDAAERSVEEVA